MTHLQTLLFESETKIEIKIFDKFWLVFYQIKYELFFAIVQVLVSKAQKIINSVSTKSQLTVK